MNEIETTEYMEMHKTIKLDIDTKEYSFLQAFIRHFIKLFVNLFHGAGIGIDNISMMESNKGLHITIHLNKMVRLEEIILFQSILFSDRHRELSNYCRHLYGKYDVFNFFSKEKNVFEKGELTYQSKEKYTNRCYWLEMKLTRIYEEITKGRWQLFLGKYH